MRYWQSALGARSTFTYIYYMYSCACVCVVGRCHTRQLRPLCRKKFPKCGIILNFAVVITNGHVCTANFVHNAIHCKDIHMSYTHIHTIYTYFICGHKLLELKFMLHVLAYTENFINLPKCVHTYAHFWMESDLENGIKFHTSLPKHTYIHMYALVQLNLRASTRILTGT